MAPFEERMATTERLLRESCAELGLRLAGDSSVCEQDAEILLGYQPGALKRQRDDGICRIPRRRIGNRWRYRLIDLAREFEKDYCA